MAALLFYLSQNRRAYAKVCAEVRGAFSSAEDIRTGPQLSSLTYLRACLDETMRISPPVGGVLWREVMEGGLDLDGEHVPAGYDVGVGIYCIHHNPAYYPQPFDYVPERWIASKQNPQEAVDLARSAFTPFSKGPRNCIGKGLAYMELTLAMARVLWMFDFRAVDDCMRRKGMQEPSGVYRQHLLKEYRLKDQFTSWKDGPMLQFRAR